MIWRVSMTVLHYKVVEDVTCLAPKTTGTIHSGSVDCILSSMSIEWNFSRWRRGSPAPTHVQHITSAASRSSFSAAFFSIRYRFSSTDESSPVSSFSCCNFWSSVLLQRKQYRLSEASCMVTTLCHGYDRISDGILKLRTVHLIFFESIFFNPRLVVTLRKCNKNIICIN